MERSNGSTEPRYRQLCYPTFILEYLIGYFGSLSCNYVADKLNVSAVSHFWIRFSCLIAVDSDRCMHGQPLCLPIDSTKSHTWKVRLWLMRAVQKSTRFINTLLPYPYQMYVPGVLCLMQLPLFLHASTSQILNVQRKKGRPAPLSNLIRFIGTQSPGDKKEKKKKQFISSR